MKQVPAPSKECLRQAKQCEREAAACEEGSNREFFLIAASEWRRLAATAAIEEATWPDAPPQGGDSP
jgi:hypothetical protein